MSTAPSPAVQPSGHLRFRVFVDFWNVQLTLNEHEVRSSHGCEGKFRIDWHKLPDCLVEEAAKIVKAKSYSYDGCIVYTSYNPKTPEVKKYRKWLLDWLDRQPGIQVQCRERMRKAYSKKPRMSPTNINLPTRRLQK
jgi:hypothetical protein